MTSPNFSTSSPGSSFMISNATRAYLNSSGISKTCLVGLKTPRKLEGKLFADCIVPSKYFVVEFRTLGGYASLGFVNVI